MTAERPTLRFAGHPAVRHAAAKLVRTASWLWDEEVNVNSVSVAGGTLIELP